MRTRIISLAATAALLGLGCELPNPDFELSADSKNTEAGPSTSTSNDEASTSTNGTQGETAPTGDGGDGDGDAYPGDGDGDGDGDEPSGDGDGDEPWGDGDGDGIDEPCLGINNPNACASCILDTCCDPLSVCQYDTCACTVGCLNGGAPIECFESLCMDDGPPIAVLCVFNAINGVCFDDC